MGMLTKDIRSIFDSILSDIFNSDFGNLNIPEDNLETEVNHLEDENYQTYLHELSDNVGSISDNDENSVVNTILEADLPDWLKAQVLGDEMVTTENDEELEKEEEEEEDKIASFLDNVDWP